MSRPCSRAQRSRVSSALVTGRVGWTTIATRAGWGWAGTARSLRLSLTRTPLGPGLGLATGEASAELGEPGAHRRAHGVEVRAEAVAARYDHHAAPAALRRHSERVAITLHNEHGNVDLVELVLARLGRIGPAGSVHRKGKAEHGHRAGLGRRPARDPRAGGASADHDRQPAQIAIPELLDDRDPCLVEPVGRSGSLPSGHVVGLLHERDAEPLRLRDLGYGHEVACRDSATCPMTEHERTQRVLGVMKVRPCEAVRRLKLEHNGIAHAAIVTAPPLALPASASPEPATWRRGTDAAGPNSVRPRPRLSASAPARATQPARPIATRQRGRSGQPHLRAHPRRATRLSPSPPADR